LQEDTWGDEEEGMKRFVLVLLVIVGVALLNVSQGVCSDIKELTLDGDVLGASWVNRVLCVDGLKVFQTIANGRGQGTGAAVSNIQLYEEQNGTVVPAKCN
jgi:hypothetical protein